jgi:hypothetical protein
MQIASRSFENVSQFKCSGTTVTNQNFNHWVMHHIARVSIDIYIYIYIETSVRNKCWCSFYCSMRDEIKRKLTSGNACYHSVQNLLSFRLLSKSVEIRIYKTVILPVVLYEWETLSLTLREDHRLRMF